MIFYTPGGMPRKDFPSGPGDIFSSPLTHMDKMQPGGYIIYYYISNISMIFYSLGGMPRKDFPGDLFSSPLTHMDKMQPGGYIIYYYISMIFYSLGGMPRKDFPGGPGDIFSSPLTHMDKMQPGGKGMMMSPGMWKILIFYTGCKITGYPGHPKTLSESQIGKTNFYWWFSGRKPNNFSLFRTLLY